MFNSTVKRAINGTTKERKTVVSSENLLLSTYDVHLPDVIFNMPWLHPDQVSLGILDQYHPTILPQAYPVETVGDGNCFYRSISQSLHGSQTHHLMYRLFTAVEMFLHPTFYDTKNRNLVYLVCDNRVMASNYNDLLTTVTTPGGFAEMMHIYALSASLGEPVQSYFPAQLATEFLSEPFSKKVVGREVNRSAPPISTVMWTQMQPVQYKFDPSHFVPLVPRKSTESHYWHIKESISKTLTKTHQNWNQHWSLNGQWTYFSKPWNNEWTTKFWRLDRNELSCEIWIVKTVRSLWNWMPRKKLA
jgi:hypothetical protein